MRPSREEGGRQSLQSGLSHMLMKDPTPAQGPGSALGSVGSHGRIQSKKGWGWSCLSKVVLASSRRVHEVNGGQEGTPVSVPSVTGPRPLSAGRPQGSIQMLGGRHGCPPGRGLNYHLLLGPAL